MCFWLVISPLFVGLFFFWCVSIKETYCYNKLFMSSKTSVQRAINRKANPEPHRGPNTSINSSQMFSGGQRQYQQQPPNMHQNNMHQPNKTQPDSINKMTVAQAISLITLRLGAIESKVLSGNTSSSSANDDDITFGCNSNENLSDIRELLQNIQNRLENVENQQNKASSSSSSNVVDNQQLDVLNKALIQTKNGTVSNMKDIKELKNQMSDLKQELKMLSNAMEDFKATINERINNIMAMSLTGGLEDLNEADEDSSVELSILNNVELNISDSA